MAEDKISRSRKLFLKEIAYQYFAGMLNKKFDYDDIFLDYSIELLRESEYAVEDEIDYKIVLSEDEKRWLREEYEKIMADITVTMDCEYKKTVAELEEIQKRR